MDFGNFKNEKGITLIALAVTIVVLLILAGVTISSVFSENGIIKKAQQAENAIEKAKFNDLNEIAKLEAQINQYLDEVENINEADYATLNFQTYMGKFMRQKVDYEKMRIEIRDKENENDKIVFHIGTDWKEYVEKEKDAETQLFYAKNADLKMIQVLENDARYSVDSEGNRTIAREMASAFTDVKITNLKVKKGKEYTIKVFIQSASIVNGVAEARDLEVHTLDTGVINDTEKDIVVSMQEMQKRTTRTYFKIFDANGDGVGDGLDIMPMLQVASGLYGGEDMLFSIATDDKTEEKLIQLIDEEGNVANDIYVGFDYNRDGYITQDEGNAFKRVTLGYDY